MLNAPSDPRVAVLGPVLVMGRDGVLVEPPGALAKTLVVSLAGGRLRPAGRAVSVETIADEVWGDDEPRNTRAALQTLVSRLRTVAADGLVVSTASGYSLGSDDTDLARANELSRRAAATAEQDPRGAVALIDTALALWRGEPGADLADSAARSALVDEAHALRKALREHRAQALLAAGDSEAVIDDLADLVEGNPLQERLVVMLMTALAAADRVPDALAAFAAHRRSLRDELGTDPGPTLVELNTRLLRGEDTVETRPGRTRIGLRVPANELLGREDDVGAVRELLSASRLVTILGAGGLGKTRLAQEVAGSANDPTVVFVELASVRTDADVTLALASTLGIRELSASTRLADVTLRPDVRARILTQLSERPTLLVLDNCEQVIEGAANWAADLLAAAAGLRILATSRSPLAIGAETVYPLGPLAAVGSGEGSGGTVGPAVDLFVQRAVSVRPGVSLPLDVIERLCTRLDGLPLAIELAAARVRSMSVEQIEARLENRFALLTSGDRSAPERHRTLQAVIDWSWNLLDPFQQRALERLSLFPDGFSAEAAEQVTATAWVENVLDVLISQSLLTIYEDRASGSLRYRMLETVREYALAALAESGGTSDAERAVAAWAERFSAEAAASAGTLQTYRRITLEQDNLVAVLRRAMGQGDPDVSVSVFAILGYYWTIRSTHSEVASFAGAVLETTHRYHPDEAHADAAALSYVLIAITTLAMDGTGGPGLRAAVKLRKLRAAGGIRSTEVAAIADLLLAMPDLGAAGDRLADMRASHDRSTALLGVMLTAQLAENEGDYTEAMHAARRAWELAGELGDVWRTSMSAMMIAELSSQAARHDDALEWVDRAEAGLRELEATQDLAQVRWLRITSLVNAGREDEARALVDELSSLEMRTPDDIDVRAIVEFALAEMARLDGDLDSSLAHFRAALDSFATFDQRMSPWYNMAMAAFVAASASDDLLPPEELKILAQRLRRRVVAIHRVRPEFVDKPQLGTSVVGWSAWAVKQAEPDIVERGVELLAIGEALHSRQDLPSMRLDRRLAATEAIVGAERLAAARAAAALLTTDEAVARAYGLMAIPVR